MWVYSGGELPFDARQLDLLLIQQLCTGLQPSQLIINIFFLKPLGFYEIKIPNRGANQTQNPIEQTPMAIVAPITNNVRSDHQNLEITHQKRAN